MPVLLSSHHVVRLAVHPPCSRRVRPAVELTEEQPWECARISSSSIRPVRCLCLSMTTCAVLCGATVISEFLDETSGILKRPSDCSPKTLFSGQKSAAGRVVPGQDGADVTKPLSRADLQAADAADARRRRTGFEDLAHGARQYPPAHEIISLGWLAGSRSYLAGSRLSYADLAAAAGAFRA